MKNRAHPLLIEVTSSCTRKLDGKDEDEEDEVRCQETRRLMVSSTTSEECHNEGERADAH